MCLPSILFIIALGIAIYYRARKEEWRIYFRPRMFICAVILSSTNKWDIEPGLLSLVINHVYSVAGFHNWLIENNCYHVCMESTGKYWIPIFNYLENDIDVCLTHPKYVKAIKGKKTDKKDSKWITQTEVELYVRIKPYYEFVEFVSTIPGMTELSSTIVLAETGVDMNIFDDAKHLCSWCGLSPANNESAGKKKSVRIAKAGDYLKPMMVQCALAAIKSKKQPYFAIKYGRIKKRRGHKKAIIAIARMMMICIYHMVSEKKPFT